MTQPTFRGRVLLNAVSSYARLGVQIAVGLATVPLLTKRMGDEDYGFWVLLWSIFGYLILMDFGFGLAVQRKAASLGEGGDLKELNEVLSSVFFFSCLLAFIGFSIAFFGSNRLEHWLETSPERVQTHRGMLVAFAGFTFAAFPFGIFREVLWGRHRATLLNLLAITTNVTTFGLVYFYVHGPQNAVLLAMLGSGVPLITNLLETMLAFRTFPGLKLSFSMFQVSTIRRAASFSQFAFFFTLAGLVINRSDQIVIAITMPVGAIAVYQIGFTIANFIGQLNNQANNVVSPVFTELHTRNEREELHRFVARATKLALGVTAPVVTILILRSPQIISLWVGERFTESARIAAVLLAALFLQGASSILHRLLLMTGSERLLCVIAVGEAILNLSVSLVLLHFMGLFGVAVGTLVGVIIGAVAVLIAARARLGLPLGMYFRRALLPVFAPLLPMTLTLYAGYVYLPADSLMELGMECAAALLVYLACFSWWSLDADERDMVRGRLRGLRARFSTVRGAGT